MYVINPSVNSSVDTALVYKAEPHVWNILKINAWRTTLTHIFGLLEAGPWGVRSSTLFRCGGGESGEVLWRHWGSFLRLSVDSWDDPQVGWEEHFRESGAVGREVQGQNKIRVAGGNWEEFSCCEVVSAGWAGPGESAVNPICPFNTCSISERAKIKPFYENCREKKPPQNQDSCLTGSNTSPTHKLTVGEFQYAFFSTSNSEKEFYWWGRKGT